MTLSRPARFSLLLSISTALAADALAQSRVFASARSGNDANSCNSILTPCQTFAGAVAQVAAGGEVIVLDSGGYGPVTIAKALTIEAPPGVLAFVHPPSGTGITVNAGASDVVILRGLVLNGTPGTSTGIVVNTVGDFHVEGCVVSGFVLEGVAFLAEGNLFVKDSEFRNNIGNRGLRIAPASGGAIASIDRCRFEGNNTGLLVSTSATATVRDSVASGNNSLGMLANGGRLVMENCLVTGNGIGVSSDSAGTMVFVSNSTITDNTTGLAQFGGGTMVSRGNNTVELNATNGTFTGTYTAK